MPVALKVADMLSFFGQADALPALGVPHVSNLYVRKFHHNVIILIDSPFTLSFLLALLLFLHLTSLFAYSQSHFYYTH